MLNWDRLEIILCNFIEFSFWPNAFQGGGSLVSTLRKSYSLSDLSEPDMHHSQDEVLYPITYYILKIRDFDPWLSSIYHHRSMQSFINITWCSSSSFSSRSILKCVNVIWKLVCKRTLWMLDRHRMAVNRMAILVTWIPWHALRTTGMHSAPAPSRNCPKNPFWNSSSVFAVTLDLQRTLAPVIRVPNRCRLHWVGPHL